MGIVSVAELPREFENEVGKAPTAVRTWVCNLSNDTFQAPMSDPDYIRATASPQLTFGDSHPTWTWLRFRKATIREHYENDPYKTLVTAEYGIITPQEAIAPRDRPSVWSSEASSLEVPVFYYYDGTGNGTRKPLTNSAYDYYQGLTTLESMIKFTVEKNYGPAPPFGTITPSTLSATFPWTQLNAINYVNDATYLGAEKHRFKCAGVTVAAVYEVFGAMVHPYWKTTSTLMYRQTGWNLQLPDVGFNFIDGGQKRRAMVFDFQNAEWVASPNPVGLNGSGAQTGGAPAILERRILPEADFTTIFGVLPA